MKRIVLISALILVAVLTFGQTNKNDENFDLGVNAFQTGDYIGAVGYFSTSINISNASNAIINRAVSYYYLGDTCNFCKDLKRASGMSDTTALKLYKENCIISKIIEKIPDSIKLKHPDADHIETTHTKCSHDSVIEVYFKKGDKTWTEDISLTDGEVYTIVETMPQFPGGEEARNRFLATNIYYPELATKIGIQGTVYISFIIDKNGDVTNVKVLRGIGGGCDEESVRVVSIMPRWIPGEQNGKPIRVLYNMPIYYKLEGFGFPKNRK